MLGTVLRLELDFKKDDEDIDDCCNPKPSERDRSMSSWSPPNRLFLERRDRGMELALDKNEAFSSSEFRRFILPLLLLLLLLWL